ncbi:MAG: DNA/RNA nuclease SfsA [Spirochaetales bacterium]|nr:DNA/RNA nuclease SfsA [Spirochaetales bacterium]
MNIFSADATGELVSRPNRFIVMVRLPDGVVRAHCPNPGRLIELMNPGRTMILEKSRTPGRKTEWTLAAAEYNGETVPLYSARANAITGELIIPRLFPEAREVKAEYSFGHSRFDWHFFNGDKEIFLEVKACTLIEEGVAMFPDAPSLRASRHIEELAAIGEDDNREAHVVFVIMNPETELFIPNLHTDPDFALTLSRCQDRVSYHGVSASCTPEGNLNLSRIDVPVLCDRDAVAAKNSGVYMILLKMGTCRIDVGALGTMDFREGWYIYTGSAMKNLSSRVKRHLTKRKKKHWHIDYLAQEAEKTKAFPVYTLSDLECSLAEDLSLLADDRVEGFGSSDCHCPSHLFYFRDDPLQNRAFLNLLFLYRHKKAFET